FMTPSPSCSNTRPPGHQAATKRHLVRHPGQGVAGGGFGQAADLVQDHARLDHGGPVLGLALALAHTRLRRARRPRLVREDANVQPPLAAHRVSGGDAAGFDRLSTQPAAFEGLQAELAERYGVAAGSLTFYPAALAFSKLYPLGHERHRCSP